MHIKGLKLAVNDTLYWDDIFETSMVYIDFDSQDFIAKIGFHSRAALPRIVPLASRLINTTCEALLEEGFTLSGNIERIYHDPDIGFAMRLSGVEIK